jgi:hypothetical protein
MDLLKALFLAVLVIAAFFAVMALFAVLFPVIIFGLIVFAIWLILKATKEINANTDPDG